jgi:hypothetical protein
MLERGDEKTGKIPRFYLLSFPRSSLTLHAINQRSLLRMRWATTLSNFVNRVSAASPFDDAVRTNISTSYARYFLVVLSQQRIF